AGFRSAGNRPVNDRGSPSSDTGVCTGLARRRLCAAQRNTGTIRQRERNHLGMRRVRQTAPDQRNRPDTGRSYYWSSDSDRSPGFWSSVTQFLEEGMGMRLPTVFLGSVSKVRLSAKPSAIMCWLFLWVVYGTLGGFLFKLPLSMAIVGGLLALILHWLSSLAH